MRRINAFVQVPANAVVIGHDSRNDPLGNIRCIIKSNLPPIFNNHPQTAAYEAFTPVKGFGYFGQNARTSRSRPALQPMPEQMPYRGRRRGRRSRKAEVMHYGRRRKGLGSTLKQFYNKHKPAVKRAWNKHSPAISGAFKNAVAHGIKQFAGGKGSYKDRLKQSVRSAGQVAAADIKG
jgi:hypothetical protein